LQAVNGRRAATAAKAAWPVSVHKRSQAVRTASQSTSPRRRFLRRLRPRCVVRSGGLGYAGFRWRFRCNRGLTRCIGIL
jgi:hypothetical protein